MKIIHSENLSKNSLKEAVVALGNFDGVHWGHQFILKKLIRAAKKLGIKSCVYTFTPHPAKILSPKTAPLLIQTDDQKLRVFETLGIDVVVLESFNTAFSKQTPEAFFKKIIIKRLNAKSLIVGYDFTFGVNRSGTIALLQKFCRDKKIGFAVAKPQFKNKSLVSSTQIRSLASQGRVKLASRLMGRPFALIGRVEKGKGIGEQMGIHTANLKVENELLPKNGIYVTRTRVLRSTQNAVRSTKIWPSATSVGFNPTFPGKGFSVETHLIGFKGNLVGKKIEVAFLDWLREELTFPNTETLAVQIQKDIQEALKYHETLRHHR